MLQQCEILYLMHVQDDRLCDLLFILEYSTDREEKMEALRCIEEIAAARTDIRLILIELVVVY